MIIIDLPRYPSAAKIDWKPVQPTQVNRSEFGAGSRSTILPQGAYWSARVEYPVVLGEVRFRPWRSALMRLQGRANAFRLGAAEGRQQRVFMTVLVDGAGQRGYAVKTRGWVPGTFLLDGMFVTIGEKLHQVVADTDIAGADGKLTISIMPQLADKLADGVRVEVDEPWALMRLTSDQQGWTVDRGQQYSVGFECDDSL